MSTLTTMVPQLTRNIRKAGLSMCPNILQILILYARDVTSFGLQVGILRKKYSYLRKTFSSENVLFCVSLAKNFFLSKKVKNNNNNEKAYENLVRWNDETYPFSDPKNKNLKLKFYQTFCTRVKNPCHIGWKIVVFFRNIWNFTVLLAQEIIGLCSHSSPLFWNHLISSLEIDVDRNFFGNFLASDSFSSGLKTGILHHSTQVNVYVQCLTVAL